MHTDIGALPDYYDYNGDVVIQNVDCYSTELRLRDCAYSMYNNSQKPCSYGGGAGVRCRIIKNINVGAQVNNSVLITWEYSTSYHQSLFDVHCFSGQRHYKNIIPMSNGTSQLRVSVGDLLPNASYDCCVSVNYAYYEIRCASIRSEDLSPPANNSEMVISTCSNTNMKVAIIYIVGAVLGCIIIILLLVLAVCGGALLRSRSSGVAHRR